MPDTTNAHELTVCAGGDTIGGWKAATIESDMLMPADAFTLTRAFEARAFARLRLDAEITLCVDDQPIVNGFVEERSGDGSEFTISGKDRISRMVAESAPIGLRFGGSDLRTAAEALCKPWFSRVSIPDTDVHAEERKVAPGTSKWEALDELLQRAGYLAWSSPDGTALIIARPDFDQEAQFAFHVTEAGSNCADIRYRETNASRYAAIVTAGTGRGNDVNHAINTLQRVGIARDAPDTFNGVGRNFLHPKRLLIPVEATSVAECQRLAENEQAEREAISFEVTILAHGLCQTIPPSNTPTLYTPDIVVGAYAENTPVDGAYYVTARTFIISRHEQNTRLRCVPLGVRL